MYLRNRTNLKNMGACVLVQKNLHLDATVRELLASYYGEAAFSAVAADLLLKPCGEDWLLASQVLEGEGEGEGEASRIQWEAVESMLEQHGAEPADEEAGRRAKGNQYALPGEDMCPFRLNVRRQVDGLWKLATTNMKHNHRPLSELVQSYQNRVANLTVDMQEFITSLANAGIAPEDVLTCFRKKFPNAPLNTVKDVVNIRTPTGGGSMDASLLLQELLRLQQEDSRWFVR
eukprot:jgi/Tetstr1/433846/TSEL_023030.t1